MTVFDRIMFLLNELHIEQKVLAEYLNVKPTVFSDWKAGRNSSYLKHIDKIAEFFNVSVDYLMGKDEIKNRSMPEDMEQMIKIIQETPELKKYVDAYLKLSPEAKRQMDMFLDLLISKGGGIEG